MSSQYFKYDGCNSCPCIILYHSTKCLYSVLIQIQVIHSIKVIQFLRNKQCNIYIILQMSVYYKPTDPNSNDSFHKIHTISQRHITQYVTMIILFFQKNQKYIFQLCRLTVAEKDMQTIFIPPSFITISFFFRLRVCKMVCNIFFYYYYS